eukprot:1118764-Alexandrium_andersonii.AAC.1
MRVKLQMPFSSSLHAVTGGRASAAAASAGKRCSFLRAAALHLAPPRARRLASSAARNTQGAARTRWPSTP